MIHLQFDRIGPGAEVGPHRHGVETVVYLAAGELVFEHGEDLERRAVVGAGDVLFEAPAEYHLVRNEGQVDALALLAAVEVDPRRTGVMLRRWDSDAEPVARRRDSRLFQTGPVRHRLLVGPGDFGSATFTIGEVEIDPDGSTEWHRHLVAEHAIVVLEGRGVITVGDATEDLEPLTGIRIEAGQAHRVENTGRGQLRYYVCASPGTNPLLDREPAEPRRRRLDA
jgi:quercetin dioxygenase-like cupin family protein